MSFILKRKLCSDFIKSCWIAFVEKLFFFFVAQCCRKFLLFWHSENWNRMVESGRNCISLKVKAENGARSIVHPLFEETSSLALVVPRVTYYRFAWRYREKKTSSKKKASRMLSVVGENFSIPHSSIY